MPKAKAKADKSAAKRTVTCSVCEKTGHNARTCADNKRGTDAEQVVAAPPHIPAPPVETKRTRIDYREEEDRARKNTVPRREAPTQGPFSSSDVSPYRCVKCNAVAILVAVRVKDHNASFKQKRDVWVSDIRCEQCFNKPAPSDLILKWGAMPGEKVPVPGEEPAVVDDTDDDA